MYIVNLSLFSENPRCMHNLTASLHARPPNVVWLQYMEASILVLPRLDAFGTLAIQTILFLAFFIQGTSLAGN